MMISWLLVTLALFFFVKKSESMGDLRLEDVELRLLSHPPDFETGFLVGLGARKVSFIVIIY